jgi:DNA-binding beta-propeller fold protein YncE
VWLINTNKIEPNKDNKIESAATMIISPTPSPDGNGIYQPASDTTIVNTKLYVAEEDSMDKEINNNGHVSIWDISDTTKPQLINRLSPGKGLPENFQLGHTIYSTPDNKFVYVEDWNSGQLVKLDTATDKVIKVFNKENIGFEMPHGGFITGKYR